jgi:hypothetical protein
MIRLWLSREKRIAIREQLSAQLLLGILGLRSPKSTAFTTRHLASTDCKQSPIPAISPPIP